MGRFEPKVVLKNGRCAWCGDDPLYQSYHDKEWGRPISDDRQLFELVVLEGAQAGLNWLTVLRKRDAYRKAFHGFDTKMVAEMNDADVDRLLLNHEIIRNRAKIKSAITNARAFIKIVEEYGSFEKYILSFFPEGKRIVNNPSDFSQIPTSTPVSDAISSDMKKRGFKFFGSTICYAFLQSSGFINDHFIGCEWR